MKDFFALIQTLERELITEALVRCRGHVASASRYLNLRRSTFSMIMKRLGIQADKVAFPLVQGEHGPHGDPESEIRTPNET